MLCDIVVKFLCKRNISTQKIAKLLPRYQDVAEHERERDMERQRCFTKTIYIAITVQTAATSSSSYEDACMPSKKVDHTIK